VKKIVKNKFNDYSTEDKKNIINNALKFLSETQNGKKVIQKKKIVEEILSYLNNHEQLNVEGFVRFRLRDFMSHLNLAIEQAADEFIIEKEYNEFIDLLRYFVELQEVKIPLVNVVQNDDGSYTILDSDDNILKSNFVEGYVEELLDEDITYEDILISALINISPGKIIIHFNDPEIRETLKNIFPDLVEVCFGCDFCENRDLETDNNE
jgi:putative sporulation protein YtxC